MFVCVCVFFFFLRTYIDYVRSLRKKCNSEILPLLMKVCVLTVILHFRLMPQLI